MTHKLRFIGVNITNLQQIVSVFELYRKLFCAAIITCTKSIVLTNGIFILFCSSDMPHEDLRLQGKSFRNV